MSRRYADGRPAGRYSADGRLRVLTDRSAVVYSADGAAHVRRVSSGAAEHVAPDAPTPTEPTDLPIYTGPLNLDSQLEGYSHDDTT